MKRWSWTLLAVLISNPALASIKAYFNQNQRTSYTDPYRNITHSGDNLEQVIVDQIMLAEKTVYLAVQELRLPKIASALIEKKKLGVEVRVVLEHDYNFNVMSQQDTGSSEDEYESTRMSELKAFIDIDRNGKLSQKELEARDAIYMLQKAKIPIMDDTSDRSQGSGLMHHKFMVVDGKRVVVGSANFTMSCIHGDVLTPQSRGNANSLMVVESADLGAFFIGEFSQLWGNGRIGNFGQNKTYRGPQTVTVDGTKITVQFSPTSAKLDWQESVNGLMAEHLNSATRSIKAALFVFSEQGLSNVLEARQNRGVQIGVMIEPKFAYRDYSELLDMLGLKMLNSRCVYEEANKPWKKSAQEVGVSLLPQGDVLHHKFAVIDDQTVIMGSQNWSEAANYTNDETLMVIDDRDISDLYGQEYARLKLKSRFGSYPWLRNEIRHLEEKCARL